MCPKMQQTLYFSRPPEVKMPRQLVASYRGMGAEIHGKKRCGFWHRLGGHLSKPIMADTTTTPNPHLITAPSAYTGLTARQLKSAQAAGLLPEPLKLGIKLRAWKKSDLDRLLSGQATPSTATV